MIPKISIENLELSKIICGTNQFVGITHRANPIDMLIHLRKFKDPKTVAKFMLHLFQEHGVNCTISSPREKIYKAIKIVENETGEKYHWICSPSERKTVKNLAPDIMKQIDWCAEKEVSVCIPHRSYTDKAIDKEKLIIGGGDSGFIPYPEISAYIRDKGMIPGLSCHYIEVLKAVEKNNYDAPLVVQPLNKKGFQSNAKPEVLIKAIQSTKVHIINIKPMAAGRIKPQEGLEFCLNNIKENDFLAIGCGKNFDDCIEDGQILENYFKS